MKLELAREVVPSAKQIGLLDDAHDPKGYLQRGEIEASARGIGIEIVIAQLRTAADISAAYEALVAAGVEAVIVEQSNMLIAGRRELAAAPDAKKLPTVYATARLASYGVNLDWCFHRSASYADKILKGATPADLPVEFPTRLHLSINLKTAKALGLEMPLTLLARESSSSRPKSAAVGWRGWRASSL